MGRRKGQKNSVTLPDELVSVSKSVTLRRKEWAKLGENPSSKAAEIIRLFLQIKEKEEQK
ncbi:MAG: hypothetical protein IK079_04320 [Desulfovibrio sp.]|nr:hypothetical protein [Desulfovibrio sp.]